MDKLDDADNQYFDAMTQIHMDRWSPGRVVLVSDAGYCAAPASSREGAAAPTWRVAQFD